MNYSSTTNRTPREPPPARDLRVLVDLPTSRPSRAGEGRECRANAARGVVGSRDQPPGQSRSEGQRTALAHAPAREWQPFRVPPRLLRKYPLILLCQIGENHRIS